MLMSYRATRKFTMAATIPLRSGQSMRRIAILGFGLGMIFSANYAVESDYLIAGRWRRASSCGRDFRAGGGRAVRAGRLATTSDTILLLHVPSTLLLRDRSGCN